MKHEPCLGLTKSHLVSAAENLALGKTASQSSTAQGGTPDRAVDGKFVTAYSADSCTHTDPADAQDAWWSVDLGSRQTVAEVWVTNRGDCCGETISFTM